MSDVHLGGVGDDLERALREYETALLEADLGRHAAPDDGTDDQLQGLRIRAVRLAEALPTACWPRPVCPRCRGQREVDSVHAWYPDEGFEPEFRTVRRPCRSCWGTGLTLHLEATI